jgi:undecaprenyl-diphosphatase
VREFFEAVVLGVVQGASEFLPISSSGHLIAMKAVLDYRAPLAFDVALHLATLLAVLIYFGPDIVRLARSPLRWPVCWRITLGTVPAAALALAFRAWRENVSPWVVVVGWSLSSAYLLLSRNREGAWSHPNFPLARAFLVGGSQGIAAIIPGFSRSGSSIASGLWLGLRREEAFRFSFLLAIPVMLGAGIVEGRHVLGGGVAVPGGWPALCGALASALVVGLFAIHLLARAVASERFHRFGWYNLFAAAAFATYLVTTSLHSR